MKTKYYIKMLFPLSLFGIIFRILEIMFAIEPSSGFYYLESVIPMLFNIYVFLVIAFFLSEIFLIKTETKTVRKRLGSVTIFDRILIIIAAVFVLAGSLQDFLVELNVNFSYSSLAEVLSDVKIYILILAGLSCIFLVFFASDPKRYVSSSFMALFSLAITFYFLLRLFTRFLDLSDILSKAYSAHTILLLGFIVLAFLNFSKVLAGLFAKKYFVAFGLCAVFLAVLHIAEFAMYFLPGNPYNIPLDNVFSYIADYLSAVLIFRFVLLVSKKQEKQTKLSSSKKNELSSDGGTESYSEEITGKDEYTEENASVSEIDNREEIDDNVRSANETVNESSDEEASDSTASKE